MECGLLNDKILKGLLKLLPAQDTQNEVKHEEGANDNERHEVDRVEVRAHRVVGPVQDLSPSLHGHTLEKKSRLQNKGAKSLR